MSKVSKPHSESFSEAMGRNVTEVVVFFYDEDHRKRYINFVPDEVRGLLEQLETCREALDYISRLRHPNGNRFTEVGVANYARSILAKVSSPAKEPK